MKKRIQPFKIVCFGAGLIFALVALVSCGEKWGSDFEAAKEKAGREGKGIFLNITSFETDLISDSLQKNVLGTPKFLKKYGKKLEFVNLDFSERLKMTDLGADASEEDILKMQKILEDTADSMEIAQRYAVRDIPTTLLLTGEGFVVTRLNFFDFKEDFDPSSPEAKDASVEEAVDLYDFDRVCEELDGALLSLEKLEANVKIADDESVDAQKRVEAIDAIFDDTDFAYQRLLRRLSEKLIELDPTNSSGSVGKHVVSLALSDDESGIDPVHASERYEEAATHPAIGAEDRQFLFFQAATTFARAQDAESFSEKGGFDRIASLLTKSFEAAPESEFAPAIQASIEDFLVWRKEYEEFLKNAAENSSESENQNE